MKKTLLSFFIGLLSAGAFAQCPNLLQAMVNACGTVEGNNEFIVFTTGATAAASTYTFNYGTTNPPTTNNLAGSDATAKTGTGSVTTTAGCSVIEVTSPATSIPAGSRVIFIPAGLDQNYDVTGLCSGSSPLYVVYININSVSGTNSNWSVNGTMGNSAATSRYLQVTYSGSALCNGANAVVKRYVAVGNWPNISNTDADGNFVTWNDTVAGYYNNGCTSIILPVTLMNVHVSFAGNSNIVNWQTSEEINSSNFIIEKSYDGKNFVAAGTVAAAGYSSTVQNYRFADLAIEYRPTYYRIKTVDRNGQLGYSKIVRINPSRNNFSISNIYPNPASDNLIVEWNSIAKKQAELIIQDISGRILQRQSVKSVAGFNKQTVDVSRLPHGKYILKFVSEQDTEIDTFTK